GDDPALAAARWRYSGRLMQAGAELSIGHIANVIRVHLAVTAMFAILLDQVLREALVNGPWADHLEPIALWDPLGDGLEESSQVLETVRFAGVARASSAAGPDARVVADLAGRPPSGWHLALDPRHAGRSGSPAGQDGHLRVDPDKGRGRRVLRSVLVGHAWASSPHTPANPRPCRPSPGRARDRAAKQAAARPSGQRSAPRRRARRPRRLRWRRPPAPGRSAASTRRTREPAGQARRQRARRRPPDRVFRTRPRSSGRCRARLGPVDGC